MLPFLGGKEQEDSYTPVTVLSSNSFYYLDIVQYVNNFLSLSSPPQGRTSWAELSA